MASTTLNPNAKDGYNTCPRIMVENEPHETVAPLPIDVPLMPFFEGDAFGLLVCDW